MFYPPLYKYGSLVLQEMFRLFSLFRVFRYCPNVEICVTKFVQIVQQTCHGEGWIAHARCTLEEKMLPIHNILLFIF